MGGVGVGELKGASRCLEAHPGVNPLCSTSINIPVVAASTWATDDTPDCSISGGTI